MEEKEEEDESIETNEYSQRNTHISRFLQYTAIFTLRYFSLSHFVYVACVKR